MKIGILAAMRFEARTLTRAGIKRGSIVRLENGNLLIYSGMGSDNASAGALKLLQRGCDALMSWGVAGALSGELRPGDLILPARVLDDCGKSYACNTGFADIFHSPPVNLTSASNAPLIEALIPVVDPREKETWGRRTGAVATDMESAAMARAAVQFGVPLYVVRVIIDEVRIRLPASFHTIQKHWMVRTWARFGWDLLMHPRYWPSLLRLVPALRAAKKTLKIAARRLDKISMDPDFGHLQS